MISGQEIVSSPGVAILATVPAATGLTREAMTIGLHWPFPWGPILNVPNSVKPLNGAFLIKLAGQRAICDDGCPVARLLSRT
jgi:hypothetical protein